MTEANDGLSAVVNLDEPPYLDGQHFSGNVGSTLLTEFVPMRALPTTEIHSAPIADESGRPVQIPSSVEPSIDEGDAELRHLMACAEAVGGQFEYSLADALNGAPFLFVSVIGPRVYADLDAARWAVFHELAICCELTAMAHLIEAVLADPHHLHHAWARTWWTRHPDAHDLSDASLSTVRPLLRALGHDFEAFQRAMPVAWTADERRGIRARGGASTSLHAFIRHERAQASAEQLRCTLAAAEPTESSPPGPQLPRLRL